MLCPHCGHKGHMEQIGFSSEYETFYCKVCQKKYIAYSVGHGEFGEPVPMGDKNKQPPKK